MRNEVIINDVDRRLSEECRDSRLNIWGPLEDIHAYCKLRVNIALNTPRPVRALGVNPIIAASGSHFGPFNHNGSMLAGTPLAGRILERPQSSDGAGSPVRSAGISTDDGTPPPAAPYIHRLDFLAMRDLGAPPPLRAKPPLNGRRKRNIISDLAP